MSLAPSLRSRVKRLEQTVGAELTPSIAAQMRQVRERRLAMSSEELAAHCAKRDQEAIAALTEPNMPARSNAGRAQQMRRSCGRHLLAARAAGQSNTD